MTTRAPLRRGQQRRSILRIFMAESVLGLAVTPGMATAIGSLPHRDAHAAAALVLRCLPDLPAAPELPCRSPLESVVAQWAGAIPGVEVQADGALRVAGAIDPLAPVQPTFDITTHSGLLTFLEVARAQPRLPARVKVQVVGPLTLGVALVDA